MSDLYGRLRWAQVPGEVQEALRARIPEPIWDRLVHGFIMRVPVLPEDALHIIVADAVHEGGVIRTRSMLREGVLARVEVDTVTADAVRNVDVCDHTTFVTVATDDGGTRLLDIRTEAYEAARGDNSLP